MAEYPFGQVRRVRYLDDGGQIKVVRAKLLAPNPDTHPLADVVLEISASVKAHLPLRSEQVLAHEPAPGPLPPLSK